MRKKIVAGLFIILVCLAIFISTPILWGRSNIRKSVCNNVVIEGSTSVVYFNIFTGKEETERISWVGSGVIVTKNGIVATTGHCIKGAAKLKVTLMDGRVFYIKRYYYDYSKDIGVFKLPIIVNSYSPFGYSNEIKKGDRVYSIGNSGGIWDGTVKRGKVYNPKFSRSLLRTNAEFIMIKLGSVGGDSGGGIYINGKLVGIISRGGMGATFVVPSNQIITVLNKWRVKPAVNHIN